MDTKLVEQHKDDILFNLKLRLEIHQTGYGTWEVKSTAGIPMPDHMDDRPMTVSFITHDESVKYGIFDGEKYNPLCGFADKEMLEAWVRNEWDGKTVEEVKAIVWSNHTDDDNYEPTEQKEKRLCEELYDILLEKIANL